MKRWMATTEEWALAVERVKGLENSVGLIARLLAELVKSSRSIGQFAMRRLSSSRQELTNDSELSDENSEGSWMTNWQREMVREMARRYGNRNWVRERGDRVHRGESHARDADISSLSNGDFVPRADRPYPYTMGDAWVQELYAQASQMDPYEASGDYPSAYPPDDIGSTSLTWEKQLETVLGLSMVTDEEKRLEREGSGMLSRSDGSGMEMVEKLSLRQDILQLKDEAVIEFGDMVSDRLMGLVRWLEIRVDRLEDRRRNARARIDVRFGRMGNDE